MFRGNDQACWPVGYEQIGADVGSAYNRLIYVPGVDSRDGWDVLASRSFHEPVGLGLCTAPFRTFHTLYARSSASLM